MVGGTILGGVGALVQRLVAPGLVEWQQLLVMTALSFAGTIGVSLLTAPTAPETLRHFYRTTRPFGAWGPLRKELPAGDRAAMDLEHRNDLLSIPCIMLAQVALFLMTMQFMIRSWGAFWWTTALFAIGAAGVYRYWWKNLPTAENPGTELAEKS
jgi:hypothetical protein